MEKIAHLPFPENLILRYLVAPYYLKKYNSRLTNQEYERTSTLMINLAKSLDPAKLNQRIKIKRIFGIEESSTNWSVGMTLEHLVLVGEGFMKIINQLNTQAKSTIVANPALVKPQGQISDPIAYFNQHKRQYQEFISSIDFSKNNLSASLHPWIGLLTQKDWHVFTVIHLKVHLRQSKLILEQLKST